MESDSLRLLVVDDNHDAADSLGLLLGFHDFNVQVAYDGAAALSAALAVAPDVMLVDLGMPRMDGFRLAELVRREESLQKTLLVAVTGYGGGAIEEAVRVAGFDHYLLKPVDLEHLLNLLRSARSLLRAHTEEQRNLVDELAEMARRQSEIAAAAEEYVRKNPRSKLTTKLGIAAAMLRIEFEPLFTAHGPVFDVPYLRIEEAQLRAGPTGKVLATHERYQWLRDGQAYTVLRIPSRCRIRFDDESRVCGPLDGIQFQDGYIRASLGVGPILAHLDDASGKWLVYAAGNRHSVVIIEPA